MSASLTAIAPSRQNAEKPDASGLTKRGKTQTAAAAIAGSPDHSGGLPSQDPRRTKSEAVRNYQPPFGYGDRFVSGTTFSGSRGTVREANAVTMMYGVVFFPQ
ncbi:unnamed protein product [Angiostrongylus costaricensis]|uniref:Dioxygenase n=1 Tax=Angiostrongylus costaricensis TaxID=334426 RepID=A0A0R3PXN5_ANGCS|nr:unnamed protein product [Angiostrongylus costaricensis]